MQRGDLADLRAFVAIADHLSFRAAALRLGITPSALATAPIATQSKTPEVVMAAATSSITEASPYIVRTSFTLPQVSVALADWAPKNAA